MVPVRLKIRPLWRADDRPTLQEVQFFQYLLAPRESGGMADALDLGSSAVRRGGSSPPSRIKGFLDRQRSSKSMLSVFCPSSARVTASASSSVAASRNTPSSTIA